MVVMAAVFVSCSEGNDGQQGDSTEALETTLLGRSVPPSDSAPTLLNAADTAVSHPATSALDVEATARLYDLTRAAGYSTTELQTIRAAWDHVFDGCVAEAGFEVPPRTTAAPEREDAQRFLDRQLFNNVALISTEGYHWLYPGSTIAPDQGGSDTDESPGLPDLVETSCKSRANERVAAGRTAMAADAFVQEANVEIQVRVRSNEALLGPEQAWADCMTAAGYEVSTYTDTSRMLQFVSSPEITDAEIAMALADSSCRQSSRVAQMRLDLLEAEISGWIDEHSAEIAELELIIDAEVAAALDVLEQSR
jgi:hypothetical protein